jgi:hypothetical protein
MEGMAMWCRQRLLLKRKRWQGVVAVAAVLLYAPLSVAATCVAPPQGLSSWWPGEGEAVDVMNGHVGTPAGGVSFAQGLIGQAWSFDGSGHVAVPDQPNLNLQRFTIAVWVFATLLDGQETELILSKEPESGFDFALTQYEIGIKSKTPGEDDLIPRGHLAFYIGGLSGLPNDYSRWVDGGQAIPLNAWTHVALTFDGTSAVAYINGTVTRSLSGLAGTIGSSASPLMLGARSPGELANKPQDRFNGLIDEVEIYDRALTAEEVAGRFKAGSMGLCFPCDADANGLIDSADALAVLRFLKSREPLPGNGDCDTNGRVDLRDAIAVFKTILTTP